MYSWNGHGYFDTSGYRNRKKTHALAAHTGRTGSYYPREVIERGPEDVEDYYLAANVLERVHMGEEGVSPLDDGPSELDQEA